MRQRVIVLWLAITLLAVFIILKHQINLMKNVKINLKDPTTEKILNAIQRYDFNGKWIDMS